MNVHSFIKMRFYGQEKKGSSAIFIFYFLISDCYFWQNGKYL